MALHVSKLRAWRLPLWLLMDSTSCRLFVHEFLHSRDCQAHVLQESAAAKDQSNSKGSAHKDKANGKDVGKESKK